MQQPELVLVHTNIRYHGSPITVIGRPDTGLLVVADFDTPAARAIGLITAQQRHGHRLPRGRAPPGPDQGHRGRRSRGCRAQRVDRLAPQQIYCKIR